MFLPKKVYQQLCSLATRCGLLMCKLFFNGPTEEDLAGQKTRLKKAIQSIVLVEAEKEVLLKNQTMRLRWGAVKNRTRSILSLIHI